MTAPAFVNVGTFNNGLGGFGAASAGASLPGSRSNGNLLLAFLYVITGGLTISVGNPGWAIGDHVSDGNASAAWAWRLVDGSEAVPFFSWTGSAGSDFFIAQCYQFSGNAASPIGNTSHDKGNSTALLIPSLTTTADDSLALAFEFTASNEVIDLSSGSGSLVQANFSTASYLASDKAIPISGGSSGNASDTITSAPWSGFQIEILAASSSPPTSNGGAALLGGI